jgi:hypothetical protein
MMTTGEANIRRTYYNGEEASQDVITKGTYGFVFRVTKEDDEKLDAIYGLERVRIAQYVQIKTPGSPNGISGLPVVIYWDPRNTRDGSIKDKFNGSKDEQYKWSQGILRLKTAGVPPWYLERILEIIIGLKRDADPIYVNPQELAYTPPTTTQRPAPPQQQNYQGRSQGQNMITRAEQDIYARPQPAPARPKSAAQPQSIARSQSTARPQAATTPQSNTPSTGPNIKIIKKRNPEPGDDGGQPLKRKKPLPGPSNLRRSTVA